MHRLVVFLTSMVFAATALGDPSITWDKTDVGGGLYSYVFLLHGNDGQQASFFVDLLFAGSGGGVIQQMDASTKTPPNVDSNVDAATYNGQGSPPYDMQRDSYFWEPFPSNAVDIRENPNLYEIEAGTGPQSQLETALLATIACTGDVAVVGDVFRGGETFFVSIITRGGDANWDGAVNIQDLAILATNFDTPAPNGTWGTGDFNGDRAVNIQDLAILATNFDAGKGAGAPAAALPEPGAVLLLAAGWAVLARRRRR